ncbi:MAG: hypothetical protein NW201_10315, partial [Gemmatimonadales bacterium]|nr:hypothetical protein [Gemmatimonadales bacterium]
AAGPLPAELEVRLARAVVVLPALLAEGRAADLPSRDPEGFAERRALGFGYFLAGEAIRVRTVPSALQLLEGIPGIEFSGPGIVSARMRLLQPCVLRLFLNGSALGSVSGGRSSGSSIPSLLASIPKESVEAIEVYPSGAGAPAWTGGVGGGCGAIVVWTK